MVPQKNSHHDFITGIYFYRHTFEVSPVFSVVETVLLNHIQKFVGFDGEGIFCPGK